MGELSSRLSMDKATVHRLVNTLNMPVMNQNKDTKRYSNSFKLLAMATGSRRNRNKENSRPI